jgi:pantetheine-phosphate adenylyltransferase
MGSASSFSDIVGTFSISLYVGTKISVLRIKNALGDGGRKRRRVEIARAVFHDRPNVEVDTFEGLLVNYVMRRKANVIVRGLRAVSDFEYEMQMALMNRELAGTLETVFMMPAAQYSFISSRLIKEVFALGGKVHGLVPELVEKRLREKQTIRT